MKVSIAIPFYNNEKDLPDAIRSVFAQDYNEWELILIDDGSSDRSLEIAKSISDPRVKVFSDGLNKKLAMRLNQVTNLSKYDYIARMDADDLMSPCRISKQMDILKKNPDLDVISSGLISIDDNNNAISTRGISSNNISLNDLLSRIKQPVHAAAIIKKDWYKRNRYDQSLAISQDYALWLEAAAQDDFGVRLINQPLYYYREGQSLSLKKLLLSYRVERQLYKIYSTKYQLPFLYVKSLLRTLISSILQYFGVLGVLLKRRNNSIKDKNILKDYKKNLDLINNTYVPGMDEYLDEKK